MDSGDDVASKDFFTAVPNEIKLKILCELDFVTLRTSIPLVNKELNKLSKDPTLFQRYKVTDQDSDEGARAGAELTDKLFRQNLKELTVKGACMEKIKRLEFAALEKLVIDGNMFDEEIRFFRGNQPVLRSVELRGTVYAHSLSLKLMKALTSADTIMVECISPMSYIDGIPAAKRYVIAVSDRGLKRYREFLEKEEVRKIRERSEIRFSINSELNPYQSAFFLEPGFDLFSGPSPDEHPPQLSNILQPAFTDLLGTHLVSFTWAMKTGLKDEWKAISEVCKICAGLTEIQLDNLFWDEADTPKIEQLATNQLEIVRISAAKELYDEGGELMKDCALLISNAQHSLFLAKFEVNPSESFQLKASKFYLTNCYVRCELFLQLPDCLDSLTMIDCTLSSEFPGSTRTKWLPSLTFQNCDTDVIHDTLRTLDSQVHKLRIELTEDTGDEEDEELRNMLSKLDLNSKPITELQMEIKVNVINPILELMLTSASRLNVLDLMWYDSYTPLNKQTLSLLQRFTLLKRFSAHTRCRLTKQDFAQYFPHAVIDIRKHDFLKEYNVLM